MSDIETLIQCWLSGDESAAQAIYNQCRGTTYGLAYALLDNSADADEVTQDVLAYALSHIDRYDPQRARFTTWLHTITVSRCRNKRRRHFLPSVPLFAWLEGGNDEADSTFDLEALVEQHDTRDEIWAAIHSLNHPLREAILLRHWADYSYQEMAQILGCPLRTAQSRVRLAHQQLQKLLAAADTQRAVQASGKYDHASD
jgi:RNA polymerase sigma-70 factor (ECF subfamily)